MNSKYSIKSFIVFWGAIFCATALFFSIVVTQVFFNSYILSSSFKELKTSSQDLERFIDTEIESFESLHSEKVRSDYFLKAVEEKAYKSLSPLFINWTEAHKLQDIFLYNKKGELLDLERGEPSVDKVSLSKKQMVTLNKGDLKSVCELSDAGVLIDVNRQIRNNLGEVLGYFSQRKKLSFKDIHKKLEDNLLVIVNSKKVFFNSMKLNSKERLKVSQIFTDQKLDRFVLTFNAEKYDFIRIKPCSGFSLFVGNKNLQQEIYFNFYKKFFPFLVLFLLLTGVLFSISFYRQVLRPLKNINKKIISKKKLAVETSIFEIQAISSLVDHTISGLEKKVQKTNEGRKKDINRLVASVAHELNNSLSYLGGNLEFLSNELNEESIDKEEAIEAIKSARLGFTEIKKIVSDLKVFSSSGAILRKDIKLKKIKKRLLEKYPELIFNESFDNDLIINSDFERVMQILFNLVQNAITAAKSKEQEIIHFEVEVEGEDFKIFVNDKAGGIKPAIKDKVFEPFFTTKKTEGGTGLGLALSKNLAESLDGDLFLVSSDQEGSSFCLLLRQSIRK